MTNITINAGEMPDYETASPVRHPWWQRPLLWIAAARRRAAAEREVRKGIDEISVLGDWLLADIGLTHGTIEHAVRNGHPRDL
jgi:hypothetical protein